MVSTMRYPDEPSELDRLVEARRRYAELRDALPSDGALDRDLRAQLTASIHCLDVKIASIREQR